MIRSTFRSQCLRVEFSLKQVRRFAPRSQRGGVRLRPLLHILGAGLVLMLAFQNCADENANVGGRIAAETGSPVSVINPVSPSADLQFIESKVAVASSTEELLVQGRCSLAQEGARPSWTLNDGDGRVLFSGHTECRDGQFAVDLRPLAVLNCGTEVKVVARLGAKSPAELRLERRCEADVVKSGESLKVLLPSVLNADSLSCVVEISRNPELCQHVCYDSEGRVSHTTALSGAICE